MKSLSQSEYGELRFLYESMYAPEVETILEDFTDEDLDLTDEEIEEQVEEVFLEFIEEGYDIDEIENIICEAIDTELEVLNEVTSPAKVAALRMKNKNAAAAGEGRGGDAGAKARAKLNVSKQKVGGSSEKKASTLSRVKGAVKKVAKAAQGGVGLAARAVGTAQRAASAVKGAAKSGYERGRQGSGGSSSGSSSSTSTPSSSSSSSSGSSTSSSSSGGGSSSGSSEAPKKRKDGLLKRAIKKVVRGVSKGVSAAAGAVKAGADSITDRARKESMNHTDVKTIQELYNSIYESQQVDEELIDEDSRRKALRQEELEATGLFSDSEIEAIMEAEMSEGYKEISFDKHQRMYDRYKKLGKAAMQDARDSGEASGTNRMKMGKMSAVIDKSSENLRKKQTKDQLTGRG